MRYRQSRRMRREEAGMRLEPKFGTSRRRMRVTHREARKQKVTPTSMRTTTTMTMMMMMMMMFY